MILRWLICFSASVLALAAATVSGHVELRDSRDPVVRNRADYSGVIVSLKPWQSNPAAVPAKRIVMWQKNKTFSPHVLAVPIGTVVDFPNADPIFHNAFSSYSGQIFDIGLYPPGSTRSVRFAREGVVRVFCNIHAEMSAVIVVAGSPYFTTTKRDGSYEISGVPPGDYDLSVFHERALEPALRALTRKVVVGPDGASLPVMMVSEAGYLPIPHKNKYGHDYGEEPLDRGGYSGKK